MAAQTWTLFDQDSYQHSDYQIFGKLPHAKFSVHRSGLAAGVEFVDIDNGRMMIRVLPTRGMSIWKANYRHDDDTLEPIGWKSPVRGPVHPSFVPLAEPSGLGWLDGFDELLVRCGLESNGAPEFGENGQLLYPLHGRIGNKPAYRLDVSIDDEAGEIALTGWVEETRFHFFKVRMKSTIRTQLNANRFDIEDEITNLSASHCEVQMLYHVNFGEPLLDAGAQVLAPAQELVPRNAHAAAGLPNWNSYSADTPGYEEQVYFASLFAGASGDTRAMLRNAHGTRAAVLHYNIEKLPCLSVWKNTAASEDGYVTGIEPGTNFPNSRTFEGEQGRVIRLDGKASTSLKLGLEYCVGSDQVEQAEVGINRLQASPTQVHSAPRSVWCEDVEG